MPIISSATAASSCSAWLQVPLSSCTSSALIQVWVTAGFLMLNCSQCVSIKSTHRAASPTSATSSVVCQDFGQRPLVQAKLASLTCRQTLVSCPDVLRSRVRVVVDGRTDTQRDGQEPQQSTLARAMAAIALANLQAWLARSLAGSVSDLAGSRAGIPRSNAVPSTASSPAPQGPSQMDL